jgi:hypothetical protein
MCRVHTVPLRGKFNNFVGVLGEVEVQIPVKPLEVLTGTSPREISTPLLLISPALIFFVV